MGKRTVIIQNPARISVESKSLKVENDKGSALIPLEDIWVVILETHRAILTSNALAALADAGIGLMTCNGSHMPNGLHLPLGAHSRHAAIVEDQLVMSKPLKKRLWQRIIVAKLTNQSKSLEILGYENESKEILSLSRKVLSGDADNREAVGASLYFKTLIHEGSRRDSKQTALLDYGYAILRSGIAREAVSGGWLVSRGVHHSSDMNAFNLVDDLIEPYRPVVDLIVFNQLRNSRELGKKEKKCLAEVFEYKVSMDGRNFSVRTAIEKTLATLRHAVVSESASLLMLPKLLPSEKVSVKEG